MGVINHGKKRIGWMGGSFNPIHLGHLVLAEYARDEFDLERVVFIPNGNPAYPKEEYPIDSEHRMKMVELAIREHPYFEASSIEIDREGPCYSIDTLTLLQEVYPPLLYQYFFITGMDTVNEFISWKDPVQVLEKTEFIAGSRPGITEQRVIEKCKYLPGCIEKIHFLEIPLLEISSSTIRKRIRSKKSIRYLVPDSVFSYINEKGLYL